MQKQKSGFDIVNDVLERCILAYPVSSFVISLYKQYQQRGSLSKKQLEGLYGKASKIEDINPGILATLEALIKRMPNRFKSELPEEEKEIEEDPNISMLNKILETFPQHKAAMFLNEKIKNGISLSAQENSDVERFYKLANK